MDKFKIFKFIGVQIKIPKCKKKSSKSNLPKKSCTFGSWAYQ